MAHRDDLRRGGVAERDAVMAQVVEAPADFYDDRYRHGFYREELLASGYDACVLEALRWGIDRVRGAGPAPREILDLGCGQGRCMGELAANFPRARLTGADVSHVGLELARGRFPDATYLELGDEGQVPAGDGSFDLIAMIDVIEHVVDAGETSQELRRLLRPGGSVIITTPCANRGSIAWWFNLITGGFEATLDGYGRFATDEPAHLRRLRSHDLRELLGGAGLEVLDVRWWGHLATALADVAPGLSRLPLGARQSLARLDWRLARRLPNGAAMVAVARKPVDEHG
jgi:SAM-dependent methyltransferase